MVQGKLHWKGYLHSQNAAPHHRTYDMREVMVVYYTLAVNDWQAGKKEGRLETKNEQL